jgi:L-serine dehydratase
MYNKASELIQLTIDNNCSISEVVINNEIKHSGRSREAILDDAMSVLKIMMESAKNALDKEVISVSGLTGGSAKKVEDYRKRGKTICGDTVNKAMARALSSSEINAAMGRIVAAPTAGACGIVPAAIITAGELIDADDNTLINALFTSSGVGQLIAKNATLSGAEGGCQAECGSAAAMAAAAIVEMHGGTPEMAFHAAAMTIKNILGLVCDPVAGLVEMPCAKRNAMGVVNAMLCADMALAGVVSMIPFDEVVDAMYKVGKTMPHQLRETALGGLAVTPTGLKLKEQIK